MGTNYYVEKIIPDEHKLILNLYGAKLEPLHLGKASAGWEFVFRGYRELNLTSLDGWLEYITTNDVRIVNEYDEEVILENFLRMVYRFRKTCRCISKMEEHCVHENHELDRNNNLFIFGDFT